jgi:hypothetical protein
MVEASARCRELALAALAAWDVRRGAILDPAPPQVRYAAPAQEPGWELDEMATPAAGARPSGHGRRAGGSVGRWLGARPGRVRPCVAPPGIGSADPRVLWMALGPSAAAGLLSLLLVAVLLLGG